MDEAYLDEGPAVNFETATLEIAKDSDGNEFNHATPPSNGVPVTKMTMENANSSVNPILSSRNVSNIYFKHIDIHSFFSDRNEIVERAFTDCQENLINEDDGEIIGSWLLTEISLWDMEKERFVLLTKETLYTIKYDFISLKILEYNRVPLSRLDTVVAGELIYPRSSLAPQRLVSGIRLMWNKGHPLSVSKKWNPFAKDIPFLTYTNHPLFWYKGSEADKARFGVDGLYTAILSLLPTKCNIISGSIIIENYFGLGALVHNRNGLGFFKIRGKGAWRSKHCSRAIMVLNFETFDTKQPEDIAYQKWLRQHNWKTYNINMDEYYYMEEEERNTRKTIRLESEWLMTRISVTCIVFVKQLKLAKSIKATWGPRCNNIYLFGQHFNDTDIPVISIGIKLVSSWQFLCETMNYVWKDNGALDWIIFVKDDTMVIPENLRHFVALLNHEDDHYLGHPVVMWGQPYNVAQAGYVLSKAAYRKVMQMFNNSEQCASGGKYWKKEDYYLAKHLSSLGIHPSDTRDQYLRGTFHGYSLQNLLWGIAKPGSYWTHALYPIHGECCSSRSITFGAGEADKMYTLNYLLYHLHVFNSQSIFGAKHASILVAAENVWRIALKEEFNITYLNEISSDTYYEIWHSKYAEPEQLIAQNYKSMPEVLSSLLTAYELENKSFNKSVTK
ncbi:hypothetical protein KM043_018257 [Ampulex compressa]|nr:hypothetical protein KM043_018257 [Ampulex compressa]